MQGRPEAASTTHTHQAATTNPEKAFAPLPLRSRGTLEILDVAIRVYKQYFWVLIGWSAIVSAASQVPYIAIFLWPLLIGSAVCCITAAVRGQAVKFNQCGQFTQPRYGAILGTAFFGVLVFFILAIAGTFATIFMGAIMISALERLPGIIQFLLGLILFLVLMLALSCALVWLNVAMVVVCMEPGKAGSRAMGRAFELLKGYWLRVSTILTLLSIAMLLLLGILWAAGLAIFGAGSLPSLMKGEDFEGLWTMAIIGGVISAAIGTLWNPIFYLTLTLFYLDLRVRKEALDIEWGAHVSTQAAVQNPVPPTPSAVWAPESDPSLQSGQPSFRAALASVNSPPPNTPPPAPAPMPMTPEQQAWFGVQSAPPADPPTVQTFGVPAPTFGAPPAPAVASKPVATTPIPSTAAPVAPPAPLAAAPVICSQCGQSSPAGQTFCMNCGSRIQPAPSAPPAAPDSSSTPQW